MRIIADLHIHSPYSRAVSKEMTLENLDIWAKKKGINIMGTGDFTHPVWIKDIKDKLEPAEQGLYKLKMSDTGTRFMLSVEISSIYKKNNKVRRVHNIIFAPSIEIAEKINAELGWRGNLRSDGRPILGLDSKELLKIVLGVDERCMFVPAHAWTPWFSIFGSMSGFNSIEECFDEYAKHIFAIETGLSSDPAMNWRWSHLNNIALISNSDSHSLPKIGREANVFDTEFSYNAIKEAIKSRDPKKFLFTIEFFPEEGKYHYDGHRDMKHSQGPDVTKKHKGLCGECGKKITVGVMSRVEELADQESRQEGRIPYKNLIPLNEIIAEAMNVGVQAKKVKEEYDKLILELGSEFFILLDADENEIRSATTPAVTEAVIRVRKRKVNVEPGYDGEYGKIKIFDSEERNFQEPQAKLF
ncbi:endonuclease Q family protein [Patescibacteria group bacterium]